MAVPIYTTVTNHVWGMPSPQYDMNISLIINKVEHLFMFYCPLGFPLQWNAFLFLLPIFSWVALFFLIYKITSYTALYKESLQYFLSVTHITNIFLFCDFSFDSYSAFCWTFSSSVNVSKYIDVFFHILCFLWYFYQFHSYPKVIQIFFYIFI